jgi:hypothetical protein
MVARIGGASSADGRQLNPVGDPQGRLGPVVSVGTYRPRATAEGEERGWDAGLGRRGARLDGRGQLVLCSDELGATMRNPQIWASLVLGVAVGMLVGLSVSPVVASVLGALTGLLAMWFGLAEKQAAGASPARILGFGVGIVLATPAAVWARTHRYLEPSLAEQRSELVAAGVPEVDATALVISARYGGRFKVLGGAVRGNATANSDGQGAVRLFDPVAGVLFSEDGEGESTVKRLCEEGALSSGETLERWVSAGGVWAALAEAVASGESGTLDARVKRSRALACAP